MWACYEGSRAAGGAIAEGCFGAASPPLVPGELNVPDAASTREHGVENCPYPLQLCHAHPGPLLLRSWQGNGGAGAVLRLGPDRRNPPPPHAGVHDGNAMATFAPYERLIGQGTKDVLAEETSRGAAGATGGIRRGRAQAHRQGADEDAVIRELPTA